MSAFYVGEQHVTAILSASHRVRHGVWVPASVAGPDWPHGRNLGRGQHAEQMTALGLELLRENRNSLAARYPSDFETMLDGNLNTYRFRMDLHALNRLHPAEIAKLVDCYEYQSCEHEGWAGSDAKRWCDWLRGELWSLFPEYDDGAWTYRPPAKASPPAAQPSLPLARSSPWST